VEANAAHTAFPNDVVGNDDVRMGVYKGVVMAVVSSAYIREPAQD
jgi:hypothetical protein